MMRGVTASAAFRATAPVAVGLIMIIAAIAKAGRPGPARFVIEYALGRVGLSEFAFHSHSMHVALVVFEIILGVWLLSGWRARSARRVALGTISLFTLFLVALVYDPAAPPCACTGWISLAKGAHTANILGVGRNLLLIALLLVPATGVRVPPLVKPGPDGTSAD